MKNRRGREKRRHGGKDTKRIFKVMFQKRKMILRNERLKEEISNYKEMHRKNEKKKRETGQNVEEEGKRG